MVCKPGLRKYWLGVAAALLVAIRAISAGELPLSEASQAAQASPADLAALVEQLDSAEFGERQAATEQLHAAGLAAFESLERAALHGSREASVRAFSVLREHFTQGDRELQRATYEILDRLMTTAPPSVAQRAQNILKPPQPATIPVPAPNGPPNAGRPRNRGNFGGGFGGNFQGNFRGNIGNRNPPFAPPGAPLPGGVRRMSLSVINGRRILELDERERRIKLSTDRFGAISAEITETQNGRNVTRAIEAKDLDELKRKDAELARLYEQYNRPGPVGAIGPAAPFGFIQPPPAPPRRAIPAEMAQQQRELLDRLIQQQKQRLPGDPNAQRLIDVLERAASRP